MIAGLALIHRNSSIPRPTSAPSRRRQDSPRVRPAPVVPVMPSASASWRGQRRLRERSRVRPDLSFANVTHDTTIETRVTGRDRTAVDVVLWDYQIWATAFAVDVNGTRGSELRDEPVTSEEELRGFLERAGVDPRHAAEMWASSTRPKFWSKRKSRWWRRGR
jgi:hypothetical protein